MFVAAIVVVVPVVGALGFGCRLPEVGCLAWTLRVVVGLVVVALEEVVVEDVVGDGLAACDVCVLVV
jgi:hypothetical protein